MQEEELPIDFQNQEKGYTASRTPEGTNGPGEQDKILSKAQNLDEQGNNKKTEEEEKSRSTQQPSIPPEEKIEPHKSEPKKEECIPPSPIVEQNYEEIGDIIASEGTKKEEAGKETVGDVPSGSGQLGPTQRHQEDPCGTEV